MNRDSFHLKELENSNNATERGPAKCSISDGTSTENVITSGRKRGRPRKNLDKPPQQEKKKKGRPKKVSNRNLACETCGKVSKNIRDLNMHEKIHFGIKDFECEYCHMRFVQKGTLKVHLRTHTGEKPYKCEHCPEAFAQKISLDNHVFKHTQQGVKCPLCPSVHATPSSVKQHVKQVHSEDRPNVCQMCGRSYKKRRDLMKHIEGHDRRICSVCDKVFDTMYALKTHMHVHAANRCSFCNRSFKTGEELQAHGKLRGRAHQCELCCYSFNKAEFLSNHHRRNHWKAMGLEQLVWNFPPRPKKPKPPKKVKPPIPSEYDHSILRDTAQLIASSNLAIESVPTEIEPTSSKQTEISENEDQSDIDSDYPEDEIPLDTESDSELKSTGNLEEKAVEKTDLESTSDFVAKIKDDEDESPPLPVEVFVKLEDFGEETMSQLENKVVEFKNEYFSDSVDDDVPLAMLMVTPRVEQKPPLDYEVSQMQTSEEDNSGEDLKQTRTSKKDAVTKLECQYCHERFSGKRILKDHLKTHTGDKPFKCQHCSESFRYNCLLKYHMFKHTNQGIRCDLCSKVFASPAILKQHRENVHTKEKRHNCKVCDKSFKYGKSLRKHLQRHEDKTCKSCGEVCKGKAALIEHQKTAHPAVKDKTGPLICELCGKTSASASSLAVHRGQHKEYQRFKCDECPKAFVFNGLLQTHKRVEHHGERHICPTCGKQFKLLTYLKRHSYQHKEDKVFKCDKCSAAFRHPSTLRYHLSAKHSETMFPCSLCSKEFRTADGLRVHRQIHSDDKRFHCEFCPREFIQKTTLLKHMKIHSADRQLKCVVCGQIYYKKVELTIHQAKEHPNHPLIGRTVKLHTCGICGMNFIKEGLLRQHSDIHGSEYKFKCDMCDDKKFKQMAGLRYHWNHFHGIEPPKRKVGKRAEKKTERVSSFDDELELMMQSTAVETPKSNVQ